MTAGEITAIGTVAGTVVAALLKGLPAVIRSLSTARRAAEKARREGEEAAAEEKAAAEARRDAEVFDMRQKLHNYAMREHACEIKLTRALAWLAHLEAALTLAGIKFVPYNAAGGRADSDVVLVTPGESETLPDPPPAADVRQNPKKKGKP